MSNNNKSREEISKELKVGKVGKNGGAFMTPKGRLVFHNVFDAKAYSADKKPKFDATVLFDKSETDVSGLNAWIEEQIKTLGKTATVLGFKNPLRDADVTGHAIRFGHYENCFFLASSNSEQYPPEVLDELGRPLTAADKAIYSGCFVRLLFTPYYYNNNGNKGISLNLKAIQKLDDGERFVTGEKVAVDEFFSPVVDGPASMDPGVENGEDLSNMEDPFKKRS